MSQDIKLHIFQQIHTPSGNRLTGSYFCSVTGYDKQTSFTALILATVPVHETSLVNQHSYSMLLGRREGVHKKSTLCTLVKMLKIMDNNSTYMVYPIDNDYNLLMLLWSISVLFELCFTIC